MRSVNIFVALGLISLYGFLLCSLRLCIQVYLSFFLESRLKSTNKVL